MKLITETAVDYTILFRELSSNIPEDVSVLEKSFYMPASESQLKSWQKWLKS